jgi:hypothetical protein
MNGPEMPHRSLEITEAILADVEGVTVTLEVTAINPAGPTELPVLPMNVPQSPPPDLLAFMGENRLDVTGLKQNHLGRAA